MRMYEHVRLILACVFVHVCVLCVCQLALVKRAWAKVRAEQHMRVFVCVCVCVMSAQVSIIASLGTHGVFFPLEYITYVCNGSMGSELAFVS